MTSLGNLSAKWGELPLQVMKVLAGTGIKKVIEDKGGAHSLKQLD